MGRGYLQATGLLVGCLTRHPKVEETQASITHAPPGGPYSSASVVTVTYGEYLSKNGVEHPTAHKLIAFEPSAKCRLSLDEARDFPATHQRFLDTVDEEFLLKWAPDGKGIAASKDTGKSWMIYDFEVESEGCPQPVPCTTGKVKSVEPWPVTHKLFEDVL